MEFRTETHEIVGFEFEPCGKWIGPGRACMSTRRFAVRRQHIGLYCGAAEPHQHEWPLRGGYWASREDFDEDELLAGWVPPGAFADRTAMARKKRAKSWQISPSRRAVLQVELSRADTECMLCENRWYRGERDSVDALRWLKKAELRGLYREVEDAVSRMVPKPTRQRPNWYSRLPDDLRYEVGRRFDLSRLHPDHPFWVEFLRAAKKRVGKRFTRALQRYAVDSLAMPLCERCSLGRGARLFERPEDVLQRWAKYRFRGDVDRAKADAEHLLFEYLVHLAYETDIAETLGPPKRQRRTGNT
jgi:hypothetical protein